MNKYKELSLHIRTMNAKKRLLLFRGDDELAFLNEWIERRPEAINKNEETAGNSSTREVIENCSRCSNIYNKKFGYGNGDNGILILLNMPKAFSDSERNSLKSESINLLKKMMQAIDIDFEQCYTTNLIKCESRDVLNRPSLMFQNCENIFRRELKEKIPKIVIIMGSDTPLKKIINENININWHNIEHPITLIKNPDLKRPAWETLKMIKAGM